MNVFDVRRVNLRSLIEERFEGNRAAFCRHTGKNPNLINLLLTHNKEYHRNIGEKLARDIEGRMSLQEGWLDRVAGATATSQQLVLPVCDGALPPSGGEPEPHTAMSIPLEQAKEQWAAATTLQNLCGLVISEDAMAPTLAHGDMAIVDRGINEVGRDGIYCINRGGRAVVRRFQTNMNGTLTMLSDSPSYKSMEVSSKDLKSLEVFGRVVGAFRYVKL
jgi:hypothetical protein